MRRPVNHRVAVVRMRWVGHMHATRWGNKARMAMAVMHKMAVTMVAAMVNQMGRRTRSAYHRRGARMNHTRSPD